MAGEIPPRGRYPLLALAAVAMLAGVAGGLGRLGLSLPLAGPVAWHGPLLASAFFGTVIALERAVAYKARWAYLAPLFSALAGPLLVHGFVMPAAWCLVVASGLLAAVSSQVARRHEAPFTAVIAIGAFSWLAGSLAWVVTGGVEASVPLWMNFLVLTIAGERLELSRLRPPSRWGLWIFAAVVFAALLGAAIDTRLLGIAYIALAWWLLRFDIARFTIRQPGLPRYVASCLLPGFAWLAVGGVLWARGPHLAGTAAHDAALHAVLVGFVLSMVFGHAPIILPAVTGWAVPFTRAFYAPLVVLHASVALRVVGDLGGNPTLRLVGSAGHAAALVLFGVAAIGRRGRPQIHEKKLLD